MPRKKRAGKAHLLDDSQLYELQYGPGEYLINGTGYFYTPEGRMYQHWRDIPPAEQEAILDRMRHDWQRHHRKVCAAWEMRDDHGLWVARKHYGDPAVPWAQREFGVVK